MQDSEKPRGGIFESVKFEEKKFKLNVFFSRYTLAFILDIDNSLMQPHLISFQNTVYASNPRCPPDYGSPHANNSNQVFNLNGEVNFGVNSDGQYMNMNYINYMLVSDLEVYSVKGII